MQFERGKLRLRDKVWFRNRRFKQRKQQKQQQQSLQQSSQILPAKRNMPSSLRMSTNPYSFFPTVLNLHSSPPYQPMSPSDCSEDFVFTESPEIDFQVQDPQLERLMASVPALFPNTYDIIQIIELYSFPGECEVSSCSFSCLCQYLSHARSQLEGQTVSLSTFHGPAVGPPPGQTCTPSIMSQGSAPCSLRDSPAFQSLPTR
ncbi:arginine-fifty homeobox [Heterocephalus glaber]|uniref:Arginine-fifty homeobox n=1 Tax=Heterocephalus glaber TaxID=10181 RepID=A0AAX6THM2_HETGA|nr:arginine-fifty homeobox [Heterocephalus glaber]